MADLLADFKATLETGNRLLQMQAYMHPPEIMKESIKGLAESLVTKACGIPFVSVEQVEALHTLITGSILEKDQQAKLTSVLTAKCFASTRGSGETQKDASVTKQAVQLMTAICAYMSQKDWVILEDPHHSTLQNIDTVCERCRKVGLTHPSEVTFKHLATLVARVHCAGSTPEQLYNLVRELKQAFAARKGTRVGCSRLPRFPESPSFLPDGVYECGYPDPDDQPAKRELDGLHQIFVRVPLRVSNKSIQSCSSSGASSSQLVAAPQPLQTDGIPAIMQALGGLLSQLQPAPGRQQGSPLITFLNGQQAPQTPAQGYGQAGAQGGPIAMPFSPTVALQGSSPPQAASRWRISCRAWLQPPSKIRSVQVQLVLLIRSWLCLHLQGVRSMQQAQVWPRVVQPLMRMWLQGCWRLPAAHPQTTVRPVRPTVRPRQSRGQGLPPRQRRSCTRSPLQPRRVRLQAG